MVISVFCIFCGWNNGKKNNSSNKTNNKSTNNKSKINKNNNSNKKKTEKKKEEPKTSIEAIRNYYKGNQDLVENIVYKFLQKNDKKEDISLLNELKEKELNDILGQIKKQAS